MSAPTEKERIALARKQDAKLTVLYAAIDKAIAELTHLDCGDGTLSDIIADLRKAMAVRP